MTTLKDIKSAMCDVYAIVNYEREIQKIECGTPVYRLDRIAAIVAKESGIEAETLIDIYYGILTMEEALESINEREFCKNFENLKSMYPDAIILFNVGDLYQCYNEDAKDIAKILDIALSNDILHKGQVSAGFSCQSLDIYLPKLVRAGRRVVICNDMFE